MFDDGYGCENFVEFFLTFQEVAEVQLRQADVWVQVVLVPREPGSGDLVWDSRGYEQEDWVTEWQRTASDTFQSARRVRAVYNRVNVQPCFCGGV